MKRIGWWLVLLGCLMVVGLKILADIHGRRMLEREHLERVVQFQHVRLAELQRKVGGGGLMDFELLIPPQDSVGVEFGMSAQKRHDGSWTAGIRIINVFRDSSAGRAGVLPGDWIVVVSQDALCNEVMTEQDSSESWQLARKKMMSDAAKFFMQAPNHYTLTVVRDGKELKFALTRGPVAPGLAKYIRANREVFEQRLIASRPLVDVLVTTWTTHPQDQSELTRRDMDLNLVEDVVTQPWREMDELLEAMRVPHSP